MRFLTTLSLNLISFSVLSQSALFVHVNGKNDGTAYTRVEVQGVNVGTLDVNEHLITDLAPGLNKITFYRRGHGQIEEIIMNENKDYFIQINISPKNWDVKQGDMDERPPFTTQVIKVHKGGQQLKEEVTKKHSSNGKIPIAGSSILTIVNDENTCHLMTSKIVLDNVNSALIDQYKLVNRNDLETILNEQKLSLSGLISINQSIEAGSLMGAEYSLVGSYQCTNDEGHISITLNFINCETSQIVWVGILNKIKPSQILQELKLLIN